MIDQNPATEDDGETWRCRKHAASQPLYAVCPYCLIERLQRLCPDCGRDRPCDCSATPISSSSSPSSLSSDFARSGSVAAAGSEVGSMGRVSRLIESDAALGRSRSMGFPIHRQQTVMDDVDAVGGRAVKTEAKARRVWSEFLGFWRGKGGGGRKEVVPATEVKFFRSRSVGVERLPAISGAGDSRLRGWWWYFPSSMKSFVYRRPPTRVAHQRSPLHRRWL